MLDTQLEQHIVSLERKVGKCMKKYVIPLTVAVYGDKTHINSVLSDLINYVLSNFRCCSCSDFDVIAREDPKLYREFFVMLRRFATNKAFL